jgi:hypothetical protein
MATRDRPKRSGPLIRAFERVVLGIGMSIVVFVVERRLLKALQKGRVAPAPRTAAESGENLELATAPEQIGDQAGR